MTDVCEVGDPPKTTTSETVTDQASEAPRVTTGTETGERDR